MKTHPPLLAAVLLLTVCLRAAAEKGTIKSYDAKQHAGTVAPASGGPLLPFKAVGVDGPLAAGAKVEFTRGRSRFGAPEARVSEILEPKPAPAAKAEPAPAPAPAPKPQEDPAAKLGAALNKFIADCAAEDRIIDKKKKGFFGGPLHAKVNAARDAACGSDWAKSDGGKGCKPTEASLKAGRKLLFEAETAVGSNF